MLSSEELVPLASAICATGEALGQTISATTARVIAKDLTQYPPEEIRNGLLACRRTLTGKLTLAAILQQIHALDGRPEPNEAWAMAVSAADENNSIVLTEEILLALGSARPVLDAGDRIGARMAFLSTYQRLIDESRRQAIPPNWQLSQGHDPHRRQIAISEAVSLGRLKRPQAHRLALLLHTPHELDSSPGTEMLGYSESGPPTQENRNRLQELENFLKRIRKEL